MAWKTRIGPAALAAAVGLVTLAGAGSAHAVPCSTVVSTKGLTHVIYGAGGSAITPTLAAVAYQLSKANPPITVFYQDATGAQGGYDAFKAGSGGKTAAPFKYWLTEADVKTGPVPTCTADNETTGRALDFATTGGTLALFEGETQDPDVGAFSGPAQGVNVIVPKTSSESSISTEALFFVYGFGDASQYAGATATVPWIDKNFIYQRSSTAFVQQFVRGAIRTLGGSATNFPADFLNASTKTTSCSADGKDTNQGTIDCLTKAATSGHAQEAIGFTSGPTADKNSAAVKTLAYQHKGQTTGYLPDSEPGKFDKANIRNGRYFLWDVNQFFTKITGSNTKPALSQIVNADVKNFIGYFSAELAAPTGADVNRAIAETGSIPLCAMQVQRSSDFTGLSCYAPPEPCGCYFESIAIGSSSCDACTSDDQCSGSSPKCRSGFCEAY